MNLMDLYIKVGTEGLSKTKKDINGLSAFTVAAGNLMAKGVEKGAQALVGLVKSSIEEFANFQQLEGGVEKIFGKEMANAVIENSQKAFKTAGLSSVEYLNTVTTFSSKLIADLGGDTEKAVGYADRAIRAMADNASTFGTDISAVQNAYAGFARQNYTLLDNLKLGYGGSASEMARLINESGVLGESIKISANEVNSVSFDTIIDAIETVQSRMGITGTTFNEAETTVSGSIDAMKASWRNLKVALASNGDIEKSLNEFGGSVKNAWSNVAPVIGNTLQSMWSIADQYISDSKFGDYWEDLKEKIQNCIDVAKDFFERLEKDETTAQEELALAALAGVLTAVAVALGLVTIATIDQTLATKAATLAQAALNAVMKLDPFVLIVSAIAGLVAAFAILWNTNEDFRNFWIETWDKAKDVASNAWEGIKSVFSTVGTFFKDTFSNAWSGIVSVFSSGGEIFNNIKDGIVETFKKVVNGLIDGINAVIAAPFNGLNSVLDKIYNIKIAGVQVFSFLTWRASVPTIPHLENGGILEKGQIGLLEGNGAEAVVPLENNKKWISAVARDMRKEINGETVINITINGANYSDERSLADAVSRALQNALDRRNAAYA